MDVNEAAKIDEALNQAGTRPRKSASRTA